MDYHAIVIGSGQGGNPLAQKLAADGHKVALIEPGALGGTCVNTGCTPTKTMVASAAIAHYTRNAAKWGVRATSEGIDLPAILERKDRVVQGSRGSWEKKFAGDNPRLVRGRAQFIGKTRIEVNGETLEAERIFIDTGARATIPKLRGLESAHFLTNESILQLRDLPQHLIVLGGGYVGLEFGQMFRRFGSAVTVIQSGPHILPNEDDDVTDELQKALESEGLRILLNTRAVEVRGAIQVETQGAHGVETITGSQLLVATGRSPNTEGLELEEAGVKTDEKGFIIVDDKLKTTAENIWAIGDVKGGPQFTHISYNDFQIVYGNLYEGRDLSTKSRLVPYAVYTSPELGRVGLTEKAARAQGRKIKVGKIPMTWVARAIERGETAGLMKIVLDAETDRVIGAAILSEGGGELVQILSTLMLAEKPYTLLKGAIYIHPTLAEGFFSLMENVK